MNNTIYITGESSWEHGEKMRNDWHVLLGPCPSCGTPTFDYGGGWRCLADYCNNNTNNPAGSVGDVPEWWNKGVQVIKDGNAWISYGADFVNMQESVCGDGNTPAEAVKNYTANLKEMGYDQMLESQDKPQRSHF